MPGIFAQVLLGDVELFLLDDRYHRDDAAAADPVHEVPGTLVTQRNFCASS